MRYIINSDTGDRIRDVVNTIISFDDEEMNSFLRRMSPKKIKSIYIPNKFQFFYDYEIDDMRERFNDSEIYKEMIFLGENDFDYLVDYGDIDNLIDKSYDNNLLNAYRYLLDLKDFIDDSYIYRDEIIYGLNDVIIDDDRGYGVIDKINSLTNREVFLRLFPRSMVEREIISRCFDILVSDEMFNKFLDFDNNRELFGGKFLFLSQRDYVMYLGNLFGDREREINRDNIIFKFSFVTDEMIGRYKKLRDIVNIDIDMLGSEPFGKEGVYAFSEDKQRKIDNDWDIDEGIVRYVFDDIDDSYSILDMIVHIYIKLCILLEYNSAYKVVKYGTIYDKKKMEAISLDNHAVICSEFSKICTKLFNNYLSSVVSSRCVIPSGGGHEVCGVLVRNLGIRVDLDATNATFGFNDLSRAKLGLSLGGINYICDRKQLFKRAYDKVFNKLVLGKRVLFEDIVRAYDSISSNDIGVSFDRNIISFLDNMRVKGLKGNEMVNVFFFLLKKGYFGNVKVSLIGEFLDEGVSRGMLINNNGEYYVLRSESLELISVSVSELDNYFESGKIKYEDDRYAFREIGRKR